MAEEKNLSVISNKFLKDNKDFINNVKQLATKDSKNDMFGKFVEQFFSFYPPEDNTKNDINRYYDTATNAFSFITERKIDEIKIRIYNTESICIIEILNQDMPFLVDSVTKEIESRNQKIVKLIHPVLNIKRDETGKIQSFIDEKESIKSNHESMLYIELSSKIPDEEIKLLEQNLIEVMKQVKLSVSDWHHMTTKLIEYVDYINDNYNLTETIYELPEFLNWLKNKNFIFLGYTDYHFHADKKENLAEKQPVQTLGLLKHETNGLGHIIIHDVLASKKNLDDYGNYLEVGKLNKLSPIHRNSNLDYVLVKSFIKDENVVKTMVFIGLFTTSLSYQSASTIPMLRKKIMAVLDASTFKPNSHNGKEIVSIMESLPRDELFQLSEQELFSLVMDIFALQIHPAIKLFVRKDKCDKFINCILLMPNDRVSNNNLKKIKTIFREELKSEITSNLKQITDSKLSFLYITANVENCNTELLHNNIERRAIEATIDWYDQYYKSLKKSFDFAEARNIFEEFNNAFPLSYQEKQSEIEYAIDDTKYIRSLTEEKNIIFSISKPKDNFKAHLKIYTLNKEIPISLIIPILDNLGFETLDESIHKITNNKGNTYFIHHFKLSTAKYTTNIDELSLKNAESALDRIWHEQLSNDGFNKMILYAGVNWRQVMLVRALCKYIRQNGITYSQKYIEEAFERHPEIISLIVKHFEAKFHPAHASDVKVEEILSQMETKLAGVSSLADDIVYRRFNNVIKACLRTNYYIGYAEDKCKNYISFKFDSKKVPDLPKPLPYAEIFVYSTRVEGIHLRGGKVARGGLRWSDRTEDFRTEVLGLMKTQMVKNTIIVPVGSKGGFIIKHSPKTTDRDVIMKDAIECYKTFLRGLLDITDNIIDGSVLPPKDVVRYDADDPYLVVAADKGTATFSDYANSVSAEYNFWLGDAFASGGSAGYDHKKMAITAKGGWISVERHFNEMGKSTYTHDFTCVGIGDMSGDVFGNGMLLSKHIKLVAAFNHLHIFVDPNPDAAKSYGERNRLFNLPRSNWTDYNSELLSKGAKIYERSAKSLELTPEIKALLKIEENTITPDNLIKKIICAEVDLLWNGGIGTYVKASTESHEQVGDKSNDILRVSGNELKCLVVGEGGNLGFTQKGRIEYALNGGRINTDAIDNSGGVDCSDHEVNIKIAFNKAIESKLIDVEKRNHILEEIKEEVSNLVLKDNHQQAQSVSISQMQGLSLLEIQGRFISLLEKKGLLDREVEFLPSNEEIIRRVQNSIPLTRPELSVLLAYSKLSIYSDLLHSDVPDDKYLTSELMNYFPQLMQERLPEQILGHQLKREIIATCITNDMVNKFGSSYYHLSLEDTGLKGCDLARSYIITRDVFDIKDLWSEVEKLEIPAQEVTNLLLEIKKLIQRSISWFMRNSIHPVDITEALSKYRDGTKELKEYLYDVLPEDMKNYCDDKYNKFIALGLSANLAKLLSMIDPLSAAPDIVNIAMQTSQPIMDIAKMFFAVENRFYFNWLRKSIEALKPYSYWQRLSFKTLKEDSYDQQRKLCIRLVKETTFTDNLIDEWINGKTKEYERYHNIIHDLKSQENVDFEMIVIAVKRLESLFLNQ